MKQILLSLMAIGFVGIMTVGGAFASFSDAETSKANAITTGILDPPGSKKDRQAKA